MQAGMKRKCISSDEEESSDDTWQPESSQEPGDEVPVSNPIHTRSRGPAERPSDLTSIDTAMDAVDKVVDAESDLSSDTESEDEDEDESCEEEEEEEESDEEEDYSDDDSFVTSNEDADREERDEVVKSYAQVFNEDEEVYEECADHYDADYEPQTVAEEDLSIGGFVVGSGDM